MLLLLTATGMNAQLSGNYAVPGTYTSIAAALADLNTLGVNGAVNINVNAGYTETAPIGGYTIGVITGASATNSIVIQKSGIGANPLISAFIGAATPASAIQDGVISLIGTDFLTIDGINITDGNTSNPATMEYGIGMFRFSATDGCQNNTIKNCVISLNRLNNATGTAPAIDGSRAINLVNSLRNTQTSALTITSAAGTNSFNRFYNNLIVNCNTGIAMMGFAAASPFTAADASNDVGGSSSVTSNTIVNFGGGGITSAANGIRTLAQYSLNISYNLINNNDGVTFGGGIDHGVALTGINIGLATSAGATINNNTLTVRSAGTTALLTGILNAGGSTAAANLVSINNNLLSNCSYTTATSAVFNGILNSATPATLTINSNTISNLQYAGTGTGVLIETGSPVTVFTNSNSITSINRSGASGSFRLIKTTSPTNLFCNNNFISGVIWSNLTSSGNIDGFYGFSSSVNITMTSNVIQNLSIPGSGIINGIREFGTTGVKIFQNNSINNFTTVTGGSGGSSFFGISLSTGSVIITGNTITNLNASGGTAGSCVGIQCSGGSGGSISKNRIGAISATSSGAILTGINITGGTTYTITNNVVGDFSAPVANNINAVNALNLTSGTAHNIYYNSIFLNGSSSGTNFGTSGINVTTGATLDLRNNVIVNTSTANGTGLTVAYRRTNTTLTSYSVSSNNNLLYAGVPSLSNLLFFDGTNAVSSLSNYQVLMGTRDALSRTENPSFVSTSGASLNFLNVSGLNPTQIEGGAAPIATFIDDYVGTLRNITTPDIGAWEGNYLTANCTGAPAANTVVGSVAASCPNGFVSFALANSYTVTGLAYQWQVSTTGLLGSYSNISGATNASTSQSAAVTSWYQAVITCTNSSGTSTATAFQVSAGPSPVNASASSPAVCIGLSSTVSLASSSSSLSYQWLASSTGSAGPFFAINNATLSATTISNIVAAGWYQASVSCTSAPTLSLLTNVVTTGTVNSPCQCLAYCQASATSTADDEIFNVSIGTLNNSSTCGALAGPGSTPFQYSNYSGIIAAPTLSTSLNYTLSVTVGMCNASPYSGVVTAFIDFNQNGSFADPGELVYTSPYTPYAVLGTAVSTVITIPSSAVTGITRMRVIEVESATAAGPCDAFSWGEVEDYCVVIANPPACSGTPLTSTVIASPSVVCSGGNSSLGLSTSYTLAGINYQWAVASSSVGPYTIVPSATLAAYTATNITANTWYQAVVGCANGGATIAATPAQVSLLGAPNYANVPFIENFDAPWQNRCDVRNVPVMNFWTSNPSTGNNSWRRQDDGASANWSGATSNTVAPLTGAGCADFHSYFASGGTTGDLRVYLNMSNPSPTYSLSFYYFNASGSDSLEVLLSTNGGASFTKLAGYKVQAAWGKKIINLGAVNSSSCVISFSATSDYGTSDIAIDSMEVKTCPTLVVTQLSANCSGGPSVLSVTGGSTYVWGNSATGSSITINPTAATIYSVTGSNGMCAITTTFNAQILPNPNVIIAGSSGICTGQNATLTASGANTYSWNTGATSSVIVTMPVVATVYTVTGTDAFGCVNTATQNVTVASSLSITIAGSPTVCVGSAPSLTAQGGVTYLWNTGAGTSTLEPVLNANTDFTVVGSSGTCSNSAVISVTVVQLPLVAINGNTLVCAGIGTTLTASGASTYTWNTNATTSSIVAVPTTTTTYSVMGRSSVGCMATASISVRTNTLPIINIVKSATAVCFSTTASFTASGAASYTWANGGPVSNVIVITPTNSATIYTVSGTSAQGCVSNTTTTIGVNALPIVAVAPSTATVCLLTPVNFVASGATSYTWNANNTFTNAAINFTPTGNTVYTVVGTNANGCVASATAAVTTNTNPVVTITPAGTTICSQSAASFTASGASSYFWSGNFAATAGNTYFPASTTVYTVTGTSALGCSSSATVTATTLALPSLSVSPAMGSVCVGSSATYTGSGAATYTWNNNSALTGPTAVITTSAVSSYTLRGTGANGCQASTQFLVFTNPLPVINILASADTVCSNQPVQLIAGGADTYIWSGGVGAGATVTVNPLNMTTYTVTGTETLNGCSNTQTIAIGTHSLPVIAISPASPTVCVRSAITLTASGAASYQWSSGSTPNFVNITVTPTANVSYTVTGTDAIGCVNTATVLINTNALPVLVVTPMSMSVCAEQAASFVASGANTYTWLANNSPSNSATLTLIPSFSTFYTVSGIDNNNCKSVVTTVTVNVETCTGIVNRSFANNSVSIYPNPTTGLFTTKFEFEGDKTIMITNSVGQLVEQVSTSNMSHDFDLSGLSKGVYFVKVSSNDMSGNYKIVID